VDLSPRAIVQRFRGKALRYVTVSVVCTIATQVLLWILYGQLGWSGVASNVFAVCITSIPAYLLNRYWVWGKNDKNRFWTEIVPFWGMAIAGLILSTVFVAIATQWSDSTIIVNLANLTGFGVLWVAKFLILDEVLFKSQQPAEA
jgi:putative flippase GtrA